MQLYLNQHQSSESCMGRKHPCEWRPTGSVQQSSTDTVTTGISAACSAMKHALEVLQHVPHEILQSQDHQTAIPYPPSHACGQELCSDLLHKLHERLAQFDDTSKQLTALAEQLDKAREGSTGLAQQLQGPPPHKHFEALDKATSNLGDLLITLADLQDAHDSSTRGPLANSTQKTLTALKALQKRFDAAEGEPASSDGGSQGPAGRLRCIIAARQSWAKGPDPHEAQQRDASDIASLLTQLEAVHDIIREVSCELEAAADAAIATQVCQIIRNNYSQLRQLDYQQQEQLAACDSIKQQLDRLFDLIRTSSSSSGGGDGLPDCGRSPHPSAADALAPEPHSALVSTSGDGLEHIAAVGISHSHGGRLATAALATDSSSEHRRNSRLGMPSRSASVPGSYDAAWAVTLVAPVKRRSTLTLASVPEADPADAADAEEPQQLSNHGSEHQLQADEESEAVAQENSDPSSGQQTPLQFLPSERQPQQQTLQCPDFQHQVDLESVLSSAVSTGEASAADQLLDTCNSLQELQQHEQGELFISQAATQAGQSFAEPLILPEHPALGSVAESNDMVKWNNPVFSKESELGGFDRDSCSQCPSRDGSGSGSSPAGATAGQVRGIHTLGDAVANHKSDNIGACRTGAHLSRDNDELFKQGLAIAVEDVGWVASDELATPHSLSDPPNPPSRLESLGKAPSSRDMENAAAAATAATVASCIDDADVAGQLQMEQAVSKQQGVATHQDVAAGQQVFPPPVQKQNGEQDINWFDYIELFMHKVDLLKQQQEYGVLAKQGVSTANSSGSSSASSEPSAVRTANTSQPVDSDLTKMVEMLQQQKQEALDDAADMRLQLQQLQQEHQRVLSQLDDQEPELLKLGKQLAAAHADISAGSLHVADLQQQLEATDAGMQQQQKGLRAQLAAQDELSECLQQHLAHAQQENAELMEQRDRQQQKLESLQLQHQQQLSNLQQQLTKANEQLTLHEKQQAVVPGLQDRIQYLERQAGELQLQLTAADLKCHQVSDKRDRVPEILTAVAGSTDSTVDESSAPVRCESPLQRGKLALCRRATYDAVTSSCPALRMCWDTAAAVASPALQDNIAVTATAWHSPHDQSALLRVQANPAAVGPVQLSSSLDSSAPRRRVTWDVTSSSAAAAAAAANAQKALRAFLAVHQSAAGEKKHLVGHFLADGTVSIEAEDSCPGSTLTNRQSAGIGPELGLSKKDANSQQEEQEQMQTRAVLARDPEQQLIAGVIADGEVEVRKQGPMGDEHTAVDEASGEDHAVTAAGEAAAVSAAAEAQVLQVESLHQQVTSLTEQLTAAQLELQEQAQSQHLLEARLALSDSIALAAHAQLAALTASVPASETAAVAQAVAAADTGTQSEEIRSAQLQLTDQLGMVQQLMMSLQQTEATVVAAQAHLTAVTATDALIEDTVVPDALTAAESGAAELVLQSAGVQAAVQQLQELSAAVQQFVVEAAEGDRAAGAAAEAADNAGVPEKFTKTAAAARDSLPKYHSRQNGTGQGVPELSETSSASNTVDPLTITRSFDGILLQLLEADHNGLGPGSRSGVDAGDGVDADSSTQLQAELALLLQQLVDKQQELQEAYDWADLLTLGVERVKQALCAAGRYTDSDAAQVHTSGCVLLHRSRVTAAATAAISAGVSAVTSPPAAAAAVVEADMGAESGFSSTSLPNTISQQLVMLHELQQMADAISKLHFEQRAWQEAVEKGQLNSSRLQEQLKASEGQLKLQQETAAKQLEDHQVRAAAAAQQLTAAADEIAGLQQCAQEQYAAAAEVQEVFEPAMKEQQLKEQQWRQQEAKSKSAAAAAADEIANLQQQVQEQQHAEAESQQKLQALTHEQQMKEQQWLQLENEYQVAAAAAADEIVNLQQQVQEQQHAEAESQQKLQAVTHEQQLKEQQWLQLESEYQDKVATAAERVAILQQQVQEQQHAEAELQQKLQALTREQQAKEQQWLQLESEYQDKVAKLQQLVHQLHHLAVPEAENQYAQLVKQQLAKEAEWQQKEQQYLLAIATAADQVTVLQHREQQQRMAATEAIQKLEIAVQQQAALQQERQKQQAAAAKELADVKKQLKQQTTAASAAVERLAAAQAQQALFQEDLHATQAETGATVDQLRTQLQAAQEAVEHLPLLQAEIAALHARLEAAQVDTRGTAARAADALQATAQAAAEAPDAGPLQQVQEVSQQQLQSLKSGQLAAKVDDRSLLSLQLAAAQQQLQHSEQQLGMLLQDHPNYIAQHGSAVGPLSAATSDHSLQQDHLPTAAQPQDLTTSEGIKHLQVDDGKCMRMMQQQASLQERQQAEQEVVDQHVEEIQQLQQRLAETQKQLAQLQATNQQQTQPAAAELGRATDAATQPTGSVAAAAAANDCSSLRMSNLQQRVAVLESVLLEVQAESAAKDKLLQEFTVLAELRMGAGYARTEELRRLYRDMASKDAYISRLETRLRAVATRTPSPTVLQQQQLHQQTALAVARQHQQLQEQEGIKPRDHGQHKVLQDDDWMGHAELVAQLKPAAGQNQAPSQTRTSSSSSIQNNRTIARAGSVSCRAATTAAAASNRIRPNTMQPWQQQGLGHRAQDSSKHHSPGRINGSSSATRQQQQQQQQRGRAVRTSPASSEAAGAKASLTARAGAVLSLHSPKAVDEEGTSLPDSDRGCCSSSSKNSGDGSTGIPASPSRTEAVQQLKLRCQMRMQHQAAQPGPTC